MTDDKRRFLITRQEVLYHLSATLPQIDKYLHDHNYLHYLPTFELIAG